MWVAADPSGLGSGELDPWDRQEVTAFVARVVDGGERPPMKYDQDNG